MLQIILFTGHHVPVLSYILARLRHISRHYSKSPVMSWWWQDTRRTLTSSPTRRRKHPAGRTGRPPAATSNKQNRHDFGRSSSSCHLRVYPINHYQVDREIALLYASLEATRLQTNKVCLFGQLKKKQWQNCIYCIYRRPNVPSRCDKDLKLSAITFTWLRSCEHSRLNLRKCAQT